MEPQSYRINRKVKNNGWVTAFRLLLLAIVVSLGVAALWQYLAEGSLTGDKKSSSAAQSSVREVSSEQSSQPSLSENTAISSSSEEESSELSSAQEQAAAAKPGVVEESAPVDQTYFDDAVFVGDSITEGFTIYQGMSNAKILAGTGINLSTVYTSQVIKLEDGTRAAIMDELPKAQYGKVYVMLGGNEVRDMNLEQFLPRYAKVLEDIREMQPDAVIYVQSMTPVTVNNNYNMNNDRIDTFNAAILQMCMDQGYHYLDVASAMKDENGALPTEASPKDGMHFGQPQFNLWVEYLKTHTVRAE